MAKIIESGKYPEENIKTCPSCGCKFQYYYSEVITNTSDQSNDWYFDGYYVLKYVKCPQCKNKVTISQDFYDFSEPSWVDKLVEWVKKSWKNLIK